MIDVSRFLRSGCVLTGWRLVVLLIALAMPRPVRAVAITDPVGDFLPTYTGPKAGDVDVVAANVVL